MKMTKPTSTLGQGTTMRTESAGVTHGLSARMGFNAQDATDGPRNMSGANGFVRDVKSGMRQKSVKEKGKSLVIDGGC